jgi:hypothetical protein
LPTFRERTLGIDVEDVEQSARVIAASTERTRR